MFRLESRIHRLLTFSSHPVRHVYSITKQVYRLTEARLTVVIAAGALRFFFAYVYMLQMIPI